MIEKEAMELLIVSDSHGKKERILRLLREHPFAKYLLFCGDGINDISEIEKEFPTLIVCAVKGNCDRFCDMPEERFFSVDGVRILMMHGHSYGVKGGMGAALSHAKKMNADILLYGHTHVPKNEYASDVSMSLFNPGSLAERTVDGYSYGVLEIRQGSYLLSHGSLK